MGEQKKGNFHPTQSRPEGGNYAVLQGQRCATQTSVRGVNGLAGLQTRMSRKTHCHDQSRASDLGGGKTETWPNETP